MNELAINYISLHLLFFTDWVGDEELQYKYGWSLIVQMSIIIVLGLVVICYHTLRHFYLVLIKYQRRCMSCLNSRKLKNVR